MNTHNLKKELEIEKKWNAEVISRDQFLKIMRSKNLPKKQYIRVGGPDYYFVNKLGHVARLRWSPDKREITVKTRLSNSDITERVEFNIPIAQYADLDHCVGALVELGFKMNVELDKDCDIFFFKESTGVKVHVVYYTATSGNETKTFIEVEAEHGTKAQKRAALKKWTKFIKKQFALGEESLSDLSLYEIFSGNLYRMAE